jgi:hypothetical protein
VKLNALGAALLLGCATLAQAQEAKPPPPPAAPEAPKPAAAEAPKPPAFTFALKGFVSMSACYQDGVYELSECQHSLMARAEPAADGNSLTFDVRQSRFNFSVKGPQVFAGATPTAVLEIDFFQGYGGGAYGNASLLNRLRLAYSELNWGKTRLAFGQMNDLVFAMAPVSLSHLAFPLAYATGNNGWRRPGIWAFHNVAINPDMKLELAGMLGRGNWNDASAVYGNNFPDNPSRTTLAEASGLPAIEGRVTFSYKTMLTAFVAGHWHSVDLNGVGTDGGDDIAVTSINAGAKVVYGPVTVMASGFTGANTGPLIGNLVQFGLGPNAADVNAIGYWAQAGFNFTKEFSAWFLYGAQTPDEDEAKAAQFARLKNTTMNAILQYRDGGYGLSAEWIDFKTENATYTAGAFTSKTEVAASQFIFSATYFF